MSITKGYHNTAPEVGDSLEVRLSLQRILGMQKMGQELKSVVWMYLVHWKDLGQGAVVEEMNSLIPPVWRESFPRQSMRDLMLLTGFSEVLARLFAPSLIEPSEKRLDSSFDAGSKPAFFTTE